MSYKQSFCAIKRSAWILKSSHLFARHKAIRLFLAVTGILLFMLPLLVASEAQGSPSYSPEFNAFLGQVHQVYCLRNGFTLEQLRSDAPFIMVIFFGHALRQQIPFVNQNPALNQKFVKLQQEVKTFIEDSVRTYGNRNGYRDMYGRPFTAESLWATLQSALGGQWDQNVFTNYHVAQGTLPSVLAASPGPTETPSRGFPIEEEKKELELLGVNFGKLIDKSDLTGEWHTQTPSLKDKFPDLHFVLQIRKAGNTYTGVVVYSPPGYHGKCHPVGSTYFKVERSGDVYKGYYYYSNPRTGTLEAVVAEMELFLPTDPEGCKRIKSDTCGGLTFHTKGGIESACMDDNLYKYFKP
jgi:hypothetical protein